MLGELIDARMRALGLNQTSLSALTKGELRQNYISQVVQGKIERPLGRKAELFRAHLEITREEWYRAAGMLDEAERDDGDDDPLELLFAEMRRRPEVRRAIELGSEGLEGDDLTEFLTLTAGAWASNLHMQVETARKERERAARKAV